MKKLLIILILLSSLMHADISVNQIRDMVAKIHKQRAGISLETLKSTKEPFMHIQKESNVTSPVVPKKVETNMVLHSILNGKAYINNGWKSLDSIVDGYTLKYIGEKGVVLRNENQIKKLFLRKNKENFITVESGE